MPQPRTYGIAPRIGVVVAVLALTVVAVELLVRWVLPQPLQHIQLDDELYFVNRPGARFVYRRAGEYAIPIRYNPWGFRGPIPGRDAPPGTVRVLLLGDSQTEGLQVRLEETYGSVLQQELERLVPGRRFEVVNLAVSAYGTHQELLTLKRYADRVRPDWIVLGFYPDNDLADNVRLPLVREEPGGVALVSHRFSTAHRLLLGSKVAMGGTSHLYILLTSRLKALRAGTFLANIGLLERPSAAAPVATAIREDGPSRAYRITEAIIRLMHDEAKGRGAGFVVLTIPSKTQIQEPSSATSEHMDRLEREFVADFDRDGIPHLEALAPLRQAQARGASPFFRLDGHIDVVGHRIVGETLARWLAPRLPEHARTDH